MAVFTNQATLSYSGGVTNSNITTGELLESVSMEKTAVSASYAPGDEIAYVISIVNNGTAALTGLTVTDDLGGYPFDTETLYPLSYVDGSILYYVDGVRAAAPSVEAGPPLTISGIDLPAGSNAVLIYEARTTPYAPLGPGAQIANTAAVTGAGISDLTAQASVPMEDAPRLTISKSASAEQVSLNGALSYRFVIQNSGGAAADASDAVALTDTFDPVLDGLSVAFDGAAWTAPADYTYDQATGLFATVPGQITVPAATFSQNADGTWTVDPGVSVLTVSGTV